MLCLILSTVYRFPYFRFTSGLPDLDDGAEAGRIESAKAFSILPNIHDFRLHRPLSSRSAAITFFIEHG